MNVHKNPVIHIKYVVFLRKYNFFMKKTKVFDMVTSVCIFYNQIVND